MVTDPAPNNGQSDIAAGLKRIRRRRWTLWILILLYIPTIWAALEWTGTDRGAGAVFAVWIALVAFAACRAALSPCPRCGNYFHMNGFIPLYLRRCLHCGLSLTEDKEPD